MEIAEQYGNQEIIATLKRHTTSASSGNVTQFNLTTHHIIIFISSFITQDPLYSLLGSYLELKKTKASEKQVLYKLLMDIQWA